MVNAILNAINTTPATTRNSGLKEFSGNIIEIFKVANKELSLNQIKAAYQAAFGEEIALKKFADRCWVLSDKNKKSKNPKLTKGSADGIYKLK